MIKIRKPDFENTYSKSITVGLLPRDLKALDKEARKRGCSRVQLVRESIHAYLCEVSNPTKEE